MLIRFGENTLAYSSIIQVVLSRSRATRLKVLTLLVSTGIKDLDLFFYPRANGGADNAITSVTLQNNTIKKFGGNAGLYFDGNNQTITSSITSNTITDSYSRGVYIYEPSRHEHYG